MERLVDESVWINSQLIYPAVMSAFFLNPALDASTIVWNAGPFGWSDLGWSVMFVWHLAQTSFLAYATVMTTYAMYVR